MRRLLIFLSLTALSARAQQPVHVQARLDTAQGLIGDWFTLTLEATGPEGTVWQWPAPGDTLGKLEVVKTGGLDTALKDGRLVMLQKWVLSAYDSGVYQVPPVALVYTTPDGKTDTAFTAPSRIVVYTLETDTTKPIKDIRPPVEAGVSWAEVRPWVMVAAALALLLLLYYYWRRYLKNRKRPEVVAPPVPLRPADEIALERLKLLKEKNLWQAGKVKEYYAELTDIVREYLERRYEIPALESTSGELMEIFRHLAVDAAVKSELQELLTAADLAKFAKGQFTPAAHELMFARGEKIILATRLLPEPPSTPPA